MTKKRIINFIFIVCAILFINIICFPLSPPSKLTDIESYKSQEWQKVIKNILITPKVLNIIDEMLLNYQWSQKEISVNKFVNMTYEIIKNYDTSFTFSNKTLLKILFLNIIYHENILQYLEESRLTASKYQDTQQSEKDYYRFDAILNILCEICNLAEKDLKKIKDRALIIETSKKQNLSYYQRPEIKSKVKIAKQFSIIINNFLGDILKFVSQYSKSKKIQFIPTESQKFSILETKSPWLNITLNEYHLEKLSFGYQESQMITYDNLFNEFKKIKLPTFAYNVLKKIFFLTENRYKNLLSPSILDPTRILNNQAGITFNTKNNTPVMFILNKYPYLAGIHAMLFDINPQKQELDRKIIEDVFYVLKNDSMSTFHAGFNSFGAGASIPDKRHIHFLDFKSPLLYKPIKHKIMTTNKITIGFLDGKIPSSPIVFKSTNAEILSEEVMQLVNYLQDNDIKVNFYWHYNQIKDSYFAYVIPRKEYIPNFTEFENIGMAQLIGGYLVPSPIYILKDQYNGYKINYKLKIAAARILKGIRSNQYKNNILSEYDSFESMFEKLILEAVLLSKQNSGIKKYWQPFFDIQKNRPEDVIQIKGYIISILQTFIDKGYSHKQIFYNISAKDYVNLGLVKDNLESEVFRDISHTCYSKKENINLLEKVYFSIDETATNIITNDNSIKTAA